MGRSGGNSREYGAGDSAGVAALKRREGNCEVLVRRMMGGRTGGTGSWNSWAGGNRSVFVIRARLGHPGRALPGYVAIARQLGRSWSPRPVPSWGHRNCSATGPLPVTRAESSPATSRLLGHWRPRLITSGQRLPEDVAIARQLGRSRSPRPSPPRLRRDCSITGGRSRSPRPSPPRLRRDCSITGSRSRSPRPSPPRLRRDCSAIGARSRSPRRSLPGRIVIARQLGRVWSP